MNFAQNLLAYLFAGNPARNGANAFPPHKRQGTPKRQRKNPGLMPKEAQIALKLVYDPHRRAGPRPDRLRLACVGGRVAFSQPVAGVKTAAKRGDFGPGEAFVPSKHLHSSRTGFGETPKCETNDNILERALARYEASKVAA